MRCSRLSLVALLVAAGCYVGPEALVPAAATRPSGAEVTLLTTGEEELIGELLAVRPREMVIRTTSPARLVVVPFTIVRRGSSDSGHTFGPRAPRGRALERLRLTSRYPQGVDEALESALLREYDLSRMEVLGE